MGVTPRMLGAPIRGGEDPRLLIGAGNYLEDVALTGLAHLVFARSPHAHARVRAINVTAARSAPGVLAVVTGADLRGVLPAALPGDCPPLKGDPRPPHPPLARDKVRYVGDPL